MVLVGYPHAHPPHPRGRRCARGTPTKSSRKEHRMNHARTSPCCCRRPSLGATDHRVVQLALCEAKHRGLLAVHVEACTVEAVSNTSVAVKRFHLLIRTRAPRPHVLPSRRGVTQGGLYQRNPESNPTLSVLLQVNGIGTCRPPCPHPGRGLCTLGRARPTPATRPRRPRRRRLSHWRARTASSARRRA